MQNTQSLQDIFLNQARRDKLPVTVFLMNGFQLRGIVRGFDKFLPSFGYPTASSSLFTNMPISTLIPRKPNPLSTDT
jgi:host factor-I protein